MIDRFGFVAQLAVMSVMLCGSLGRADQRPAPLVIGETFTIESKVLGEPRRINVYRPPLPANVSQTRLPVLYIPDGGLGEDFLHIAGLVQVSVANGTMRPVLLVGIENTQRRRDLTGPTANEEDRKIAPHVGGSAAFRKFLRDELMPQVKRRYRTTDEAALIGESLAGLFVVETFLLEPDLFDTYIAIDPSLWWDNQQLIAEARQRLHSRPGLQKSLFIACSSEERIPGAMRRFVDVLQKSAPPSLRWHYQSMPEETHATIYHPAALKAFRLLFKPGAQK